MSAGVARGQTSTLVVVALVVSALAGAGLVVAFTGLGVVADGNLDGSTNEHPGELRAVSLVAFCSLDGIGPSDVGVPSQATDGYVTWTSAYDGRYLVVVGYGDEYEQYTFEGTGAELLVGENGMGVADRSAASPCPVGYAGVTYDFDSGTWEPTPDDDGG